jgi:hypothetical protein
MVRERRRPPFADRPSSMPPAAPSGLPNAAREDLESVVELTPDEDSATAAAQFEAAPTEALPVGEPRREAARDLERLEAQPGLVAPPPSISAPAAWVPPTADGPDRGATAPQLRRFIKSRAYVPMHELRRRFAINGSDDDVTPVDVDRQRVYVGLPPREGSLLGELLRAGDIGYELSLDPIAPIVVGVYPMRPVPRS